MSPKISRVFYVANTSLTARLANAVNIVHMCDALSRAGNDVTLVLPKGRRDAVGDPLAGYGLESRFAVRYYRKPNLTIGRVDAGAQLFCLRAILASWLARAGILYTRLPACAYLGTRLGLRTVLEVHMLPESRADIFAFSRLSARRGRCQVVAISQALARLLSDSTGFPIDEICVYHDAVDLEPYSIATASCQKLRDELGIESNRLLVTYTGNLYEGRGIEIIVRLSEQFPDFFFLVVGGDDARLIDCRERYRDRRNLLFYGHVPHQDVPRLLCESDVLLMPYSQRVAVHGGGDTAKYCSPMKLFEYLAAGKAIVSSRLPSIQEILIDGENGLLAEPDDLESWAACLNRLSQDSSLRVALGLSARKTAERHTWEQRAAGIVAHATGTC